MVNNATLNNPINIRRCRGITIMGRLISDWIDDDWAASRGVRVRLWRTTRLTAACELKAMRRRWSKGIGKLFTCHRDQVIIKFSTCVITGRPSLPLELLNKMRGEGDFFNFLRQLLRMRRRDIIARSRVVNLEIIHLEFLWPLTNSDQLVW